MEEVWKESKLFKGYLVSNLGRVARIKNVCKTSRGYLHTKVDGEKRLIHRLVAEVFLKKIKGKDQVNHIDGNPENNCVDNLEWCSASENVMHAHTTLHKNNKRKRVVRKNIKTGKCKVYNSVADAERDNNIDKWNLRNIIRRGDVVSGCKYEYATDVDYKDLF